MKMLLRDESIDVKACNSHVKLESGDGILHVIANAQWSADVSEICGILVERGVDVNERERRGESVIHTAVIAENGKMVTWLLANRAFVNIVNKCVISPHIFARRRRRC